MACKRSRVRLSYSPQAKGIILWMIPFAFSRRWGSGRIRNRHCGVIARIAALSPGARARSLRHGASRRPTPPGRPSAHAPGDRPGSRHGKESSPAPRRRQRSGNYGPDRRNRDCRGSAFRGCSPASDDPAGRHRDRKGARSVPRPSHRCFAVPRSSGPSRQKDNNTRPACGYRSPRRHPRRSARA